MKKHLALIFLLSCLVSWFDSYPQIGNQPNIIVIFTDDQGYQDAGCYGSPDILTPNLDLMAEEGIKLTNFYAAQAVCSASRALSLV